MSLKYRVIVETIDSLSETITNDAVYGDSLKAVMDSQDSKVQIEAVKKLCDLLKKTDRSQEGEDVMCKVLCPFYMECPLKHPLKKLLSSCFLGVAGKYEKCVVQALSALLLEGFQSESEVLYRPVVGNCSALMDNFSLGQEAILQKSGTVLKHLVSNLNAVQTTVGCCENPVAKADLMQFSLFTLQVFNKILQKVLDRRKSGGDGDASGNANHELEKSLRKMFDVSLSVLNTDSSLLDLRCNAAMTLTLIMRTVTRKHVISMICLSVFDLQCESCTPVIEDFPPPSLRSDCLSPLSYLCVLNGILAMLTNEELLEHCGKGVFITDVLGRELQLLLQSLNEGPCKLLLSRNLVLFVSKCSACLQEVSHPSYNVLSQLSTGNRSHNVLSQSLCGQSPLPQSLLQYVSDHWVDSVDVIRHQANTVFEELVNCHLKATQEDPTTSVFLSSLTRTVLDSGLQCKGIYQPLGILVRRVGTEGILKLRPSLHTDILALVGEQALATYIGDLYITMSTQDQVSLTVDKVLSKQNLNTWQVRWIDPVLLMLCEGSQQQKRYVLEYIVPKLLKSSPQSVVYIGEKLATDAASGGGSLGALLMCLRQASAVGVLKQKPGDKTTESVDQWRGVLPWRVLSTALCHRSEQVRLEAFGLLCEHPKSTESLLECELALLLRFLPLSMSSQSPAFRQQFVTYIRKLLVRLRDSGRSQTGSRQKKGIIKQEPCVVYYKKFLCSLCDLLFTFSHPTGGFPSRTTALALLRHLAEIFGGSQGDEHQFKFEDEMGDHRIQTLMECLCDTFEENKKEAYTILSCLPLDQRKLGERGRVSELARVSLDLVRSTRPQDSTTAAYLFRVVSQLTEAYRVWLERSRQELGESSQGQEGPERSQERSQDQDAGYDKSSSLSTRDLVDSTTNSREYRCLFTVHELLHELSSEVQTAKTSLIHAAATKPMYPALQCIRYLLSEVNLREVTDCQLWRRTISDVVEICFIVAELVSPVVSSESPEGNVCFDENILGPGLSLDQPLLEASEQSVAKVNLMPEYLIVCCWRSIKEVSLLLGQLIQTAPIGKPDRQGDVMVLMEIKQVLAIGQYFTKQLLESVHRGAFELAYAGFIKMTDALWRSPIPDLHTLPRLWLEALVTDLLRSEPTTQLCATRRSAGLPFYIQAIVSMETASLGRDTLRWTMEKLLPAATCCNEVDHTAENTSTIVHALNVLRALFRDTRLGEDVFSFVAAGMRAAILGYKSPVWGVRNSASLLFSALMLRTFGVKRTQEDRSKKNLMTGRVFFARYPSLYEFLLEEIEEATANMGDPGHFHLHPGLYSILMLLGKLYPATMETSTSSMNLSAFVPYVNRCAHSPVYKTRVMAARAVSPLVTEGCVTGVMSNLLEEIVRGRATTNYIHGTLLQVLFLLPSSTDVSYDLKEQVGTQVLPLIVHTCKILQHRSNPCLVVQQVFSDIVFKLLHILPPSSQHKATPLQDFLESMVQEVGQATSCVGAAEFYRQFTSDYLHHVVTPRGVRLSKDTNNWLTPVLCQLLTSGCYEVQMVALDFLCESVTCLDLQRECDVKVHTTCVIEVSPEIVTVLWEILMSEEVYPECLALTLECLSQLKSSVIVRLGHVTKMLSRLQLLTDHCLDEVRCAALRLMGRVLSAVENQTEFLLCLVRVMSDRCCSQHSVGTRLACVEVLLWNSEALLKDERNRLGPGVFTMWSVLVTLLQDDDIDVRSRMADCLHEFTTFLDLSVTGTALPTHSTEPSLVLDLVLKVMVDTFRMTRTVDLLSTLFSWLEEDLEEWEADLEDKEVRLFDKGEMNTYSDDITWISLVQSHTEQFLWSLLTEYDATSQYNVSEATSLYRSCDQPHCGSCSANQEPFATAVFNMCEFSQIHESHQVVEYLTNKQRSLIAKLEARVEWVNPLSLGQVFLRSEVYRADWLCIYRLTTALSALLTGSTKPGRFSQQLKHLLETLTDKCGTNGINAGLKSKLMEFENIVSKLEP